MKAEVRRIAETCEACGRPFVPHGRLRLSPTQNRILDIVERHPEIEPERLRDLLWSDDLDGGPESRHTLATHIFMLNRKLAAHGLIVQAGRGAGATYSLRACG